MTLLSNLKIWRAEKASLEGVEPWRVLPNVTLEAIARAMPKTREELIAIKGIKEAKYRKYGKDILMLISKNQARGIVVSEEFSTSESRMTNRESRKEETAVVSNNLQSEIENPKSSSEPLSVSQFLDGINIELSGMAARVRGEVSSVDERERVVYFSLKDKEDGSMLQCLIFRSAYAMSGVQLSVGDEVIVEGAPEIWKPKGKFSMKCGFVEYAGEGALKKAYDVLLKKLETEGLLAFKRKREIPVFPHRIALLTSRDGAAIGDFMMNVGRHGYRIDFYPSSVEGARAVPELLAGLRYFRKNVSSYDVLVIVRGGGSFESLQAFNNEMLVREIAAFPIPVVAGIGHEKDVTLASLVADVTVSTPTAAARAVRQSWEDGTERVVRAEHILRMRVADILSGMHDQFSVLENSLHSYFQEMKERIRTMVDRFLAKREIVLASIRSESEFLTVMKIGLKKGRISILSSLSDRLLGLEKLLQQFDPNRALSLGYSIVRLSSGKILRSSKDAKIGDMIDMRLLDGHIDAEVKKIFHKP